MVKIDWDRVLDEASKEVLRRGREWFHSLTEKEEKSTKTEAPQGGRDAAPSGDSKPKTAQEHFRTFFIDSDGEASASTDTTTKADPFEPFLKDFGKTSTTSRTSSATPQVTELEWRLRQLFFFLLHEKNGNLNPQKLQDMVDWCLNAPERREPVDEKIVIGTTAKVLAQRFLKKS